MPKHATAVAGAVGVLVLVSGVGMAVLAVVGRSPVVVMLAGMVAFAGFVLVGPWASPWIAARLAGRRRAVPGTLAGRDMRRQPRRVAQTVLAMALGVGVTSGVLTVVSTGGELFDRQLPVQAIYVFEPGSYVSLWDDLAAATGIEPQLQDAGLISVTVPGGAEVGTVLPQVQSALQTHPDAQVITRQEAKQLMFGPMLGALVATAAMALMTIRFMVMSPSRAMESNHRARCCRSHCAPRMYSAGDTLSPAEPEP